MVLGSRLSIRQASVAILLGFLWLLPSPGTAQTLPALPQATVDTTMPSITGNTYTVNAGGSLQAAIDQAVAASPSLNHLIVLQAGATFDGSLILRARGSATGWIVIRSSAIASLPASGTRVTPAHANFMPTIRTNIIQEPGLKTVSGASRYRIVGVRVTMTTGASPVEWALVRFGSGGEGDAALPHHLILDRSWVDVPATVDARNALYLNAAHASVIDSRLSGAQQQGNESHAISTWNSPGPLLIQNNYLEAASIDVLIGGANPAVSGTGNPSDITIRQDHFTKQLRWKKNDPAWDGKNWAVKNALEFKAGTRVLVEGNVIERSWGDAQEGWLVRLVLGSDLRADIADVTFRNNVLQHGGYGLDICGNCSTAQFVIRRVLIENTLMTDIDPATWNAPSGGWAFMFRSGAQDITVRHNTVLQGGTFLMMAGSSGARLTLTDNIGNHGPYGVMGDGGYTGTAALNQYFPGWIFTKNALIAPTVSTSLYPPGNFFPASIAAVGFVDPANGDYHLAPSSPYNNAGTDGKDLGADIDVLNAATAGVIQGLSDSSAPTAPSSLAIR